MDDAHNDVNVNVSRRERAREPNRLAGLAYILICLGGPSRGFPKTLFGYILAVNPRKLVD